MPKNKMLSYLHIASATVILWLGMNFIGNIYLKYAFFALLLFVMRVDVAGEFSKKLSCKKGFISIVLFIFLSVLISRVFPINANFELSLSNVFSAIVFAPVCEELFFRRAMNDAVPGVIGALLSSAVFGIFHGASAFLPTFFAGLLLFVIYRFTGSLKASIYAHMANNTLAVITHPQTIDFLRNLQDKV